MFIHAAPFSKCSTSWFFSSFSHWIQRNKIFIFKSPEWKFERSYGCESTHLLSQCNALIVYSIKKLCRVETFYWFFFEKFNKINVSREIEILSHYNHIQTQFIQNNLLSFLFLFSFPLKTRSHQTVK